MFTMPRYLIGNANFLCYHELMAVQDSSYEELANFLDAVERHGTGILSSVEGAVQQTASEEARLLKKALLRLRQ